MLKKTTVQKQLELKSEKIKILEKELVQFNQWKIVMSPIINQITVHLESQMASMLEKYKNDIITQCNQETDSKIEV